MTKLLLFLIDFYQSFFSPDHSFWAKSLYSYGYCRFSPSCSEYTKHAIIKYGIVRGLLKSILRISRCNPFSAGGLDPVK